MLILPLVPQTSQLQFSTRLPFIKPVEVLQVSSNGRLYRDDSLGLCIDIPEGAIPEGCLLYLEIAICLYGPFNFCDALYPIAPILMLHPQNNIMLNKSIKITLPHILFIEDATDDDVEFFGIQVIKAHHSSQDQRILFNTVVEDSTISFHSCNGYGLATFSLSHFCFVTLRATSSSEVAERKGYCICPLLPSSQAVASGSFAFHLCVTYFMAPCLKVCCTVFS